MAAASGSYKQIIIKKQSSLGTLATATGARVVSRTDGAFNLAKELLGNDRIRSNFQPVENRHGARTVNGNIVDHLTPGNSSDLLGTALKRVFSSVTNITSLTLSIAAGSGGTWTVTRSAGSWFTGGLRIGMGFRINSGPVAPANLLKTLFVVDLTATVATVLVANGSTLTAESGVVGCTVAIPGRYTYMPTSGHVEEVYTVEEWQPDVPQSEVYLDWRPYSTELSIPANGNATLSMSGEGKDLSQRGASQYFTSPTGESTAPVLAGVNGVLRVAGQSYAVTSLTLNLATPYSGDPVLGSNVRPHRFAETPTLTGSFSAYFEDGVLPALFYDETATSLDLFMTADNSAACDFMAFSLPRLKVNSADKPGGRGGILRTYNFEGSQNPTVGAREATALAIHDSLAA